MIKVPKKNKWGLKQTILILMNKFLKNFKIFGFEILDLILFDISDIFILI